VVFQPDLGEGLRCGTVDTGLFSTPAGKAQRGLQEAVAGPGVSTHHDVLHDRHAPEHPCALEHDRDPVPRTAMRGEVFDGRPVVDQLSRVQPQVTGDEVEECRLAGAVRPDDGVYMSFLPRHRDVVHREDSAEGAGDALYVEHAITSPSSRRSQIGDRDLRQAGVKPIDHGVVDI
jgi:hypothetical protein